MRQHTPRNINFEKTTKNRFLNLSKKKKTMSTKNELLSDIQQVWLNLVYTSQKLEGEVYEIVSSAEQLL